MDGFKKLNHFMLSVTQHNPISFWEFFKTVNYLTICPLSLFQMEGPSEARVDGGSAMRTTYAGALARAITNFYNTYYA